MIHLFFRRRQSQKAIDQLRARLGIPSSELFIIIGRGHSGTRVMSQTLSDSGVFMGQPLNDSWDLLPATDLYAACRIMARHVVYKGNLQWDFSRLHRMPIPIKFTQKIESYLKSLYASPSPRKCWKLPETTLIFPWIARMFPEAKYIQWIRDPRDAILNSHLTDDLSMFHVPYETTDNERLRRAISWKYQVEIVKATPVKNILTVRFEDFVLEQDKTLKRLEAFLGFPLKKVPVRRDPVGRYKTDELEHNFDLFQPDLIEHGYLPENTKHV